MGETMTLRMAKASQQEINRAIDLTEFLLHVERGYYPCLDDEVEDCPTWFDPDDSDHLRLFYDEVMKRADGNHRVVWGFSTLMSNDVVDPDKDYLALHPRLVAALQEVDGEDPDRCELCGARLDVHDTDHLCRIHREFNHPCQICGRERECE